MTGRATRWVFWPAAAAYFAVGLTLTLGFGWLQGDSLSRVASAQSVLFSRDPHLAAIGFVFTPLTAVAQLPGIALSHWFPALQKWGITAAAMSALFMAAAVLQIWRTALDRHARPWLCVVITVLFAVNPIIVLFGANGMSEAPFIFAMCWAVRRLIRWLDTDDAHDLVAVGIALAVAYLARYDAIAAAMGIGALVLYASARRVRAHGWRYRGQRATLDFVIVLIPVLMTFTAWAATSWLITGEALQQFSSSYGNAAILQQSGGGSSGGATAWGFSLTETVVLAPLLPILLVVAVVSAWTRRDRSVLAPLVGFGSVLLFAAYSYSQGLTFPFLRFYIAAVPLAAVLAILLLPPVKSKAAHRLPERRVRPLAATAAVLLLAIGLPITAVGMLQPRFSQQQSALRAVLVSHSDALSTRNLEDTRILRSFSTERRIASYLDALDLPDGSVLTDTVYGFAVLAASEHPKAFVIPSDEDFTAVLNAPARNRVRYILSVPNAGRGVADAINRRYPTLYETGSKIGTLELEIPNDGADLPIWRLYRVLGSS